MDSITHVLDTHAVIWAYEDSNLLGSNARSAISRAGPRTLAISDFTLFEISMLVAKRKLELGLPTEEFLSCIEKDFVVLPVGPREADVAMKISLKQADPFDRVIVATAVCKNLPLLTKDKQITRSKIVPVVW